MLTRRGMKRSLVVRAKTFALAAVLAPNVARADPPAMKERARHPRLEVRSHDDRFSLALGGFLQARYGASMRDRGVERSEFTTPRTRISFFGHVYSPEVRYRLMLGTPLAAQQAQVLDAYVEYKIGRALRVRGGRFKIPVMREWVESAAFLASVDRSSIVQLFLPGRDYGFMVSGALSDVEYAIGVFNGAGVNAVRESNRTPALAARVVWNLHGTPIDGEVDFEDSAARIAVGASAMTTTRPVDGAVVTPVQMREDLGGVEVALRAHGFDVTAEAMGRQRTIDGRHDRVVGGYIRADQYIPAWRSSFGARVVRIHGVDDPAVSRTEVELDAGVYPAQHDLKLMMILSRARLPAVRDTYVMIQVQAGF